MIWWKKLLAWLGPTAAELAPKAVGAVIKKLTTKEKDDAK